MRPVAWFQNNNIQVFPYFGAIGVIYSPKWMTVDLNTGIIYQGELFYQYHWW